jgi:hypothetical protein
MTGTGSINHNGISTTTRPSLLPTSRSGIASSFEQQVVEPPQYPNSFPGMSNEVKGSRRSSSAAIPISNSSMMRRSASEQQLSFDEQQAEQDYQDRSTVMFSRIVAHRQSRHREQQLMQLKASSSSSSPSPSLAVEGKYVHHASNERTAAATATATAMYHYPTKGDDHWAVPSFFNAPPGPSQGSGYAATGAGYVYGSRPPPSSSSSSQQILHPHHRLIQIGPHGYAGYVDTALSVAASCYPEQHQHHYNLGGAADPDEDDCVFDLEL